MTTSAQQAESVSRPTSSSRPASIGPGEQPDYGRNETEEEREDRNLTDLLQELRVAGIGTQVLFGFLLSVPFTVRFARLDPAQRHLYMACVVLAALAIGLLLAPVAYHRLVFRQHKKARLVRVANRMAMLGLVVVGLAVSSTVLLVTGIVLRGVAVPLLSAAVVGMFTVLWVLVPVMARRLPAGPPGTGPTGSTHRNGPRAGSSPAG